MRSTQIKLSLLFALFILLGNSCNKDNVVNEDPYAGGKGSLGISFISSNPTPSFAKPGELVDFNVKGMRPFIGKFDFFINGTKVDVTSATDSLITIRLPENISSGDAKIVVSNQVYYGPRLEIDGNVSYDSGFGIINGFNSTVTDILPNAGGFIVTGSFSNFEKEANDVNTFINGIHFLDNEGKSSKAMTFGRGASGINSITKMSDGSFIVGGFLSSFNKRAVSGITRLYTNGNLDTVITEVINTTTNPKNSLDTVASFNGGISGGSIVRVFGVQNNNVVAIGNFSKYFKIDYRYSSRDTRRNIITNARSVIKMDITGKLDSAFNYNNSGANGNISDAALISNDRVLIVGSFTQYNDKNANGIVCLKSDGKIDETFLAGSGAEKITSVTYNATLKKIVVVGNFTKFNGVAAKGVVILNDNGAVDQTFVMGDVGSGLPTFGQVLNNGKILLVGTFNTYNSINRSNMLILESNGAMIQKYNSFSPFVGQVNKVVETTSSLGNPALILGGNMSMFETKRLGNFFKMEIKN